MLYRRRPKANWLAEVRRRVVGGDPPGGGQRLMRREPITLRALRDIPVPSWKLVFPDKLLQFRPLDGLRADLFTVAGARPPAWLLVGMWVHKSCRVCPHIQGLIIQELRLSRDPVLTQRRGSACGRPASSLDGTPPPSQTSYKQTCDPKQGCNYWRLALGCP